MVVLAPLFFRLLDFDIHLCAALYTDNTRRYGGLLQTESVAMLLVINNSAFLCVRLQLKHKMLQIFYVKRYPMLEKS